MLTMSPVSQAILGLGLTAAIAGLNAAAVVISAFGVLLEGFLAVVAYAGDE